MKRGMALATALAVLPALAPAQQGPPAPPVTEPPRADTTQTSAVRISLDEAIRLALQRNHALQAQRNMILQNEAQEITANLRPNPVISWDSQFFPLFNPGSSAPVTWKIRRNSISASGICLSGGKNGNTGCKRRKIRPR